MNTGKKFENLIKESCDLQLIDYYRLKDAGFFGNAQSGKRFTSSNICDYILNDGNLMIYAEAKSTGTSFRFEDLRESQREGLTEKSDSLKKSGLRSKTPVGLIIEFKRKKEKSYRWVDLDDFFHLEESVGKKSFNLTDLNELKSSKSIHVGTFLPTSRSRLKRVDVRTMMADLHAGTNIEKSI